MVPHSLLPFVRFRDIGCILPIEMPAWTTPTMILTLRGRLLGPSSLLFLDRLRELARPLDAR
jgi:hypothetical protein